MCVCVCACVHACIRACVCVFFCFFAVFFLTTKMFGYFFLPPNENTCCRYSLKVPHSGIPNEHPLCRFLMKKLENNISKASFNTLLIKFSADLSLKSALIRLIFYYKFVQ